MFASDLDQVSIDSIIYRLELCQEKLFAFHIFQFYHIFNSRTVKQSLNQEKISQIRA